MPSPNDPVRALQRGTGHHVTTTRAHAEAAGHEIITDPPAHDSATLPNGRWRGPLFKKQLNNQEAAPTRAAAAETQPEQPKAAAPESEPEQPAVREETTP